MVAYSVRVALHFHPFAFLVASAGSLQAGLRTFCDLKHHMVYHLLRFPPPPSGQTGPLLIVLYPAEWLRNVNIFKGRGLLLSVQPALPPSAPMGHSGSDRIISE